MSEENVILNSSKPITLNDLKRDLKAIGINQGDVVLVHSSLSALGWVCGGAQTVIMALEETIGETGTIVMPSHSGDWSDPTSWCNPPVPKEWIPIIKETMPAYDPNLTKTRGIGTVAELFRLQPGVYRSKHPQLSFSAKGPLSHSILNDETLFPQLGMNSPLGKLYQLSAKVLLLGVGYDSNTCFHLAETLIESTPKERNGTAMLVNNQRQWVEFEEYAYESDDFPDCGLAFEQSYTVSKGLIGMGSSRLFNIKEAVDFAKSWLSKNRNRTVK